ncbi:brp Blh family beta-carotene 15,15'-monooxygenase [Ligilactobacillus ruminis]|uniref:hypothetical protein n=1 Tax=Ligilactobacillus ruminis TaxID=1623 RepID=UPI000658F30C|nr:hypothetical protein [Ligilactobacillus ruminis]KLA45139.1 brp Blh family beta-carotene 15,15'-monooxygenase [Ligilactobacillus ruminis]
MNKEILDIKLRFPISETLKKKFPFIPEYLYLTGLFLYIASQLVQGTMIAYRLIPGSLAYHIQLLAIFIVIVKAVLFDDYSLKDWSILILLGIVLWSSGNNAVVFDIFYYYIFIVSAKGIDFKKIATLFFITITSGLIITFALAKTGLISGLTYTRPNGAMRYALGTIYPSDLAARCFCLMLAYALIKNFKLCVPEYIGMISVTIWVYVVTNTKVDLILMSLFIIVAIFYKKVVLALKLLTPRGIAIILGGTVAIIILMSYLYTPGNKVMLTINNALSGRLHLSHIAFDRYNVTPLGQYIEQRGFGGGTKAVLNYFYIDISYIRVLMMFGAIVFITMVLFLLYLSYSFMNSQAYSLEIVLIFVALSALVDQHMWELSFNIIFLATFANLQTFSIRRTDYTL